MSIIALFSMPVFAKPMVMITNPSFDENNLHNLIECDEQELTLVEGHSSLSYYDPNKPAGAEDPMTIIAIAVNESGNTNSPMNPGSIPGTATSVVINESTSSNLSGSNTSNSGWSDCGCSIPK